MYVLPHLRPESVIVYLRKSRQDDALLTVEEVLAKHEQMLNEWQERNLGGLVPEQNRYREIVSGETIDARPEVQKVLRLVESPEYKAILVVEPQRLSRGDLEDAGRIIKLLRWSNTLVLTLTYAYDLQDEHDRDNFARELKRGNEFLEYQKRIMNNGRLLSVENGNFIGQIPPYGYRKVAVKEGKRTTHTLEPDPEKAPVVHMIFELYASGMGAVRICDKLDSMGIVPPRGSRWSAPGIMTLLRNEHYIGKVVWNRRKTIHIVRDGEVILSRPRAQEYLVYDGKHPAIVEPELFTRVQSMLGTLPRNRKTTNFSNPLRGLLFCGECGRAMTRRTYMQGGVERCEPRVLCEGQRFCHTPSATLSEVLAQVKSALTQSVHDFDVQLKADTQDVEMQQRQTVERLEKRLTALEAQEVQQWRELTSGGMPRSIFVQLNRETQERKAQLTQALEAARNTVSRRELLLQKQATFKQALASLDDQHATALEQNMLLRQCISRITYHRPHPSKRWNKHGSDTEIKLDVTLNI